MSDDLTKVTVRLPATLHRKLRIEAIERETSVQALVQEAVERHLDS